MNQRTFVFTANHAFERAFFGDAEHDDVELAFAAQGEGGGIHDFQSFAQSLVESDGFIADGRRVFFRVGSVHAIDIGGFQHHVAVHFRTAAKRRCRW